MLKLVVLIAALVAGAGVFIRNMRNRYAGSKMVDLMREGKVDEDAVYEELIWTIAKKPFEEVALEKIAALKEFKQIKSGKGSFDLKEFYFTAKKDLLIAAKGARNDYTPSSYGDVK